MEKDKELEEMMNAIKNLKDKDTKDMNINSENTVQEKTDTSFYSRIFHHNKTPAPVKSDVMLDTFINLQKQLDDYFASVEFNTKLEKLVQTCLLGSVQNQIYMSQLIKELVKQYTNNSDIIEKQINNILTEEVIKILKSCTNNLANSLKSI